LIHNNIHCLVRSCKTKKDYAFRWRGIPIEQNIESLSRCFCNLRMVSLSWFHSFLLLTSKIIFLCIAQSRARINIVIPPANAQNFHDVKCIFINKPGIIPTHINNACWQNNLNILPLIINLLFPINML